MDIRTQVCFSLSRRLLRPPAERTSDYGAYEKWRDESLSKSSSAFSEEHIKGKNILDFGCGDGQLTMFLARTRSPHSVVGVDINPRAIDRAQASLAKGGVPESVRVSFKPGTVEKIPVDEQSVDTVVAFDCMEHVMAPGSILREWHRVLAPGGRCLIEWFPYKGPWGPHMESLVPIPWAHVIFGERAMLQAAAQLYDLPEFTPRHWDFDDRGRKKPNKWRAWSSFDEQAYINKLDIRTFRLLARQAGFKVDRMELHSFAGGLPRRAIGAMLRRLPVVGEYFVSYAVIELLRA